MTKQLHKIVLTGGPCAGKSTAMSTIESELSQIGYKVVIVPETATEFILNGIKPDDIELSNINFQRMLLKHQIAKEKTYEEIAWLMNSEKIVLICDRGAFDGKAYCSDEDFDHISKDLKINKTTLRDEYDAIIHLTTAAIGAEEFYSTTNNGARKETIKEAKELDRKTMEAWVGHPHLRIIDNSTDFEGKMKRVISEIFNVLGEPVPIEVSRKFLIELPDMSALLSTVHAQRINVMQIYLKHDKENEEKRIRQRGKGEDFVYTLTVTKKINSLSRIKTERKIPSKEFLSLLMEADPALRQIQKERYCFVDENLYYEMDIYPFWNDRAILEIKLTEESQTVQIPEFIKVIKEVTDDSSYFNSSLAKNIPS